ncbi:hypothetical protein BsubNA05_21760 [Bacillus subtilis]|nr:hypothetical protein B4071_1807 [Bacillus subtilis]BDB93146.1 hypothetical protein BSG8_18980 [Bacillus subtilis subsp. natto]GIN80788.1 hypothetical protein J5TS4_13660 [Bacillus sp. J5TS4]BEH05924.1 hypothetical protein BSNN_19570 [Bacillus subtilis subsp. natto]BET55070.1 hypothetical protein BsubNA05_21760 [Bacillus subtilis]
MIKAQIPTKKRKQILRIANALREYVFISSLKYSNTKTKQITLAIVLITSKLFMTTDINRQSKMR